MQERATPPNSLELVGPAELDITEYEEGRPVEEGSRE